MLFSIIVLSYNRPEQVERILNNLMPAKSENFNLIIKDDCSPRQIDIEKIVKLYKEKVNFEIIFHRNEINLGYDLNLLDAFNITDSEYVFLLSDDDFIDGKYVIQLSNLLSRREYKFYYTPYNAHGFKYRENISEYKIEKFHEVIYNSILFSGLIFDRNFVLSLPKDELFLSNCIYTQVYLAAVIVFREKRFGEASGHLLHLGGDGENFFGKNKSAVNKEILQDRSNVVADLRYQIFLLRVVRKISDQTHLSVLKIFIRQYNIRLIGIMFKTRRTSLDAFISVVKEIRILKIELNWFVKFLMIFIFILPKWLCNYIYKFSVRYFRNSG